MAAKLLRLNATVSDNRIIVSFSYPPAAQVYGEYLDTPENSYDNNHEWGIAISNGQVSMNLPPDISFELPNGTDAVLTFEDELKAMKWEEKMILWGKSANTGETKRSIRRSITVGYLHDKLGLSENKIWDSRVFTALNVNTAGFHVASMEMRPVSRFEFEKRGKNN